MPDVDLANIQGNVFRGYRFGYAVYIFLRIDDAARSRQWLQAMVDHVTTSEPWDAKPSSTVNIAVTHAGFKALEVPAASLASFSEEFQQGMAQRADMLGDTGESSPDRWDDRLGTGDIHIFVAFNASDRQALDWRCRWLDEIVGQIGGVSVVCRQEANLLPEGREHFGFADGFGQPAIEGSPNPPLPGQGIPDENGGWRSLKLGEFVLGYADEEDVLPDAPVPNILGQNGTYMVYRKLQQNVALFRRYLRAQAGVFVGTEELLAAKIVGRWHDGTPVELSPDKPDPSLVNDENRNTDFKYASDSEGYRCPRGAHIRRTNPRDVGGKVISRHRMIRRGLPYGTVLPAEADDDGQDRGVIFMALVADLGRQFEFIQSQWLNDGNIFALGTDKDFMLGDHDGTDKMTVQGRPPYFLARPPRFVTVRGGEYFFMPGINALRWLAGGTYANTPLVPEDVATPEASAGRSFLQVIEALPARLAHDVDRIGMEAYAALVQHVTGDPEPVFAVLREVKPILVTHGFAVVTRYEDVQEVLERDNEFTVALYTPKMEAITGDFILGLDNTPQYEHDHAELRLALRRDDLPRLAESITREAEGIVTRVGSQGSLDVVSDYTDVTPARLVSTYFGTPGPDDATLISWARMLFDEIFINVKNDPAVHNSAMGAAQEMCAYLDDLIQTRKSESTGIGAGQDDVLGRLLHMQKLSDSGFDDTAIRSNILGLIVGWIPTTSKAVAHAIDELLRRPEQLAGAQEAARRNDDELVASYMFEALRFHPQNFGLLRRCAVDYTVARGTDRATTIPVGTVTLVATQSAMMDHHVVDAPTEFRLDRPPSTYMHFGFGMHTCFGQYINRVQIPLLGKVLLRQRNLRRAGGEAGRLAYGYGGNFPSSMQVLFDPE
ncbi:MAG: hypothetical protein PVSMB7_19780 [Chloroflexota bacterium]